MATLPKPSDALRPVPALPIEGATVAARADDGWDDAKVLRLLARRAEAFGAYSARASWIGPAVDDSLLASAQGAVEAYAAAELALGEALYEYRRIYGHRAMAELVMRGPDKVTPAWAMKLAATHSVLRASVALAKGGA